MLCQINMHTYKIGEKYGMVYNIGTIMDTTFGHGDSHIPILCKLSNPR